MAQEKKPEKAWVDLREFGWGWREVSFIWPEGHEGGQPGPDSVGTEQIINGSVQHEDLDHKIEAEDGDIDSIFDQDGQDTDAGQGGGEDEDPGDNPGDGPAAETPEPVVVEEGD